MSNKSNATSQKTSLSRTQAVWILVLDILFGASLLWRDYSDHGQMLIGHYASIVLFTDVVAVFLARQQLLWYNIFRITGGLTFLILVLGLWAKDLNGPFLLMTWIQLLLISIRLAHAVYIWRKFGPALSGISQLSQTYLSFYRSGNASERFASYYLFVVAVMMFLPQLAYWTHSNMGLVDLDASLVGFQAQQGINFALKLLVIELLITNPRTRFYVRLVAGGLLVPQYLIMWPMIFNAPLPMAHIAFEAFALALIFTAYQSLNSSGRAES